MQTGRFKEASAVQSLSLGHALPGCGPPPARQQRELMLTAGPCNNSDPTSSKSRDLALRASRSRPDGNTVLEIANEERGYAMIDHSL